MQKPMGQMNAGAMPQPPMQGGAPGQTQPQMNMGQQQQPGAPQQMQMNQQMIILPQIDISPLSNLKQPQISEFVGNSIYGLIQNALGEEFAPRITGMLLDENAGIDFKKLLTDNKYFTSKVYEAHQLILSSQRQWVTSVAPPVVCDWAMTIREGVSRPTWKVKSTIENLDNAIGDWLGFGASKANTDRILLILGTNLNYNSIFGISSMLFANRLISISV